MIDSPLVSVIIPAYNAEQYLAEAVGSVVRQTWANLEIIIVDDGSSDRTAKVADELAAKDSRIRVIHKANGGVSSARNAGLRIARGVYLCFLDADDSFLSDKLERQVAFLREFRSCDLVYSDYYWGDGSLAPMWIESTCPPRMPMEEILTYRNWFGVFCPLFTARLLAKVGYFDEELDFAEDFDYWVRASKCGRLSYLPGPVAVYRTHPGQAHRNRSRLLSNRKKVIQKNFALGSRAWHTINSTGAWYEARWHRFQGQYLLALMALGRCLWHCRSPKVLRKMMLLLSH